MNTYSIILTDGKIIEVKATEIEFRDSSRCVRLKDGNWVAARFNMDNIAGWVEKKYMGEVRE